ncbi:MAG: tyrosine-type recombinase/integrase [Verrucomicrobiae bacterium]|nr:tyrosine-type recombinase/integrase [Verrucomicrobiae bacterium]
MSLELRKSSKWWYGVFMENGQKTIVNLKVPIAGKRPPKRTMQGDDEFEQSRGMALAAYDLLARKMRDDRTGEKTLQKLAEMKTGREVTFPKLAELADWWAKIPRRKTPDERYALQVRLRLKRFAEFVAEHQKGATEFIEVKPATAQAFMDAEADRNVSPKTWNDTLKLLRATFKHLHPQLADGSNPFHGLVTKASETVNREPFSVEELKAIVDTCAGDDFIRPIIVTGMCTAMRRGDCCLLKWADVDLKAGFLSVETAKTGERVDIPIFPMLAEELHRAKAKAGKSEFCFPEAAQMYQNNPDGITWRVKQVIARALESMAKPDAPALPPPASAEEVRTRVDAYLTKLGESKRAVRLRAVFDAYAAGAPLGEVMAATGFSRGAVSNYLNELERETGTSIVRGNRRAPKTDALQEEREVGLRRASLHDFHSFRVTWITLALAAGVPLELVQRVTGHRTVEVVMKHYFRPGREDFRQVLVKAMPKMLGVGERHSAKDEMRAIIQQMTPKNCRDAKSRLLELLDTI